jgi:hypothetical protein
MRIFATVWVWVWTVFVCMAENAEANAQMKQNFDSWNMLTEKWFLPGESPKVSGLKTHKLLHTNCRPQEANNKFLSAGSQRLPEGGFQKNQTGATVAEQSPIKLNPTYIRW